MRLAEDYKLIRFLYLLGLKQAKHLMIHHYKIELFDMEEGLIDDLQ